MSTIPERHVPNDEGSWCALCGAAQDWPCDAAWLLDRADELAAALALQHIEGCHSGCARIDGECTARIALARYRGDE